MSADRERAERAEGRARGKKWLERQRATVVPFIIGTDFGKRDYTVFSAWDAEPGRRPICLGAVATSLAVDLEQIARVLKGTIYPSTPQTDDMRQMIEDIKGS